MATGSQQEPVQERLKEQVSVSVKEALEKTTNILSNLHRVQSYLYVLRTVTSTPQSQGLKTALQQMHTIRNDTACLLQTVYLAEIGIQSLQDYDKGGGVAGSSPFPSLMLDLNEESTNDEGAGKEKGGRAQGVEALNSSMGYDDEPPAKRSKSDQPIAVVSCTQCGRKYANQSLSSSSFCRACRQNQGHAPNATPSLLQPSQATNNSSFSNEKNAGGLSTPRGSRGGGRGNLNRMSCKQCGASFLYKRCLHRHIREHHTELDLTNIAQYIQVISSEAESPGNDSNFMGVTTPTQAPPPVLSFEDKGVGDEDDQQVLASITAEMGVSPVMDGGEGLEDMTTPQENLERERVGLVEEGLQGRDDDKFVCPTCNKVFDRPYRFQRHLQIHNPNRPKVNCHLCDKTFTRMDTLENHMKCLHSNDRPFKCTFSGCPKRFPLQSALIHHLKIHMDGKPYKCNECEDSFALLGEFRVHISEVHADTKDLRCSECYKVFGGTEELGTHVKMEHRLECEVCMRTFSRLAYLQAHIEIHNGPALFNCRYCMAGFDSEYAYKKHLKTHSNKQGAKPRPAHSCNECGLSFESSEELIAHYQTEEHQSKMESVGMEGTSILHSIQGDLSSDIRSLVDEVTGSIGAAEVMQSIGEREMLRATTVTIDVAEGGGVQYQEAPERRNEGTTKRVHFADHSGGMYGRKGGKQVED